MLRDRSAEDTRAKPTRAERERQIAWLAADGLQTKGIAGKGRLEQRSVETVRRRLLKKPGHASPAEWVRCALREGVAAA